MISGLMLASYHAHADTAPAKPMAPTTQAKPSAPPSTPTPVSGPAAVMKPPVGLVAKPPVEDPKAPPDVAAPPKEAQKTASGLASKVIEKGSGKEHPEPQDVVEVDYSGWMTDGTLFDSSVKRGQPAKFPLNRVIPGWTEGVQLMVVGETRRFWIPAALAYGDTPKRPGGPHGMLVFDVKLLGITKGPKPIPAPADVKAPPASAQKTASGISYLVIQKGTGTKHPKATDQVEVHYTGWMTDGKMFDSSVVRGKSAEFPLNQVIPGWSEAVQLMVEGEKTRFWIPGKLAYGDTPSRPGVPSGMLVFEIELIKIK